MRTAGKEVFVLVALLFGVALFLRVAYVGETYVVKPIRVDAKEYVLYALNFHERGVYSMSALSEEPVPDSYRPPGYPVFVALAMKAGGRAHYYDVVRYAQAALGALLIPLVFLLCLRTHRPFWAAAVAGLTAFSPHLVAMTSYVLTETLYSFLLLGALTLFVWNRTASARIGVAAGLAFGLAALTNPTCLPLPFVLAAVVVLLRGATPRRRRVKAMAAFLAAFLILPVGWKVRNAIRVEEGAQSSDRALKTIAVGSYPGYVHENPELKYFPHQDDPEWDEYTSSFGSFLRILLGRVRERPGRYLKWYLLEKPVLQWSWSFLRGSGDIYVYPVKDSPFEENEVLKLLRAGLRLLHLPLTLLAFLGILAVARLRRRASPPVAVFTVLLFYTVLGILIHPLPRYAVPLKPMLFAASLWPLSALLGGGLRAPGSGGIVEEEARSGG